MTYSVFSVIYSLIDALMRPAPFLPFLSIPFIFLVHSPVLYCNLSLSCLLCGLEIFLTKENPYAFSRRDAFNKWSVRDALYFPIGLSKTIRL